MLSCARDQRLVDNDALTELVSTGKDFIEIRRLLTYGADPNAGSILTAAAAGQPELVSLLLDFGATVSSQTVELAKGTAAEDVVLPGTIQ
eukprot:g21103.t1